MSTETPSIITTHKTSRALPTSLLQNLIKPFGNKLVQPGDALPAGSPVLTPDSSVYKYCNVEHRVVEGIHVYDISAKSSSKQHDGDAKHEGDVKHNGDDEYMGVGEMNGAGRGEAGKRKQIYYFCGGGWQSPPSKEHWKLCTQLAQAGTKRGISTTVSVISYPLAPNSPASITLPLLEKLYYTVLSPQPTDNTTETNDIEITLAGDSSGANIALSLTLSILNKDEHAPAPHALLLLSPPVDLRNTNPEMQAIEPHDPVLTIPFVQSTARAWCTGVRSDTPDSHPAPSIAYDDPCVSPLFADVAVLRARGVLVHGVVGGYDVLTPDALLFREKLVKEGVKGRWLEWERQMHCFILAGAGYGLPEGKEAVEWVEGVLFDG